MTRIMVTPYPLAQIMRPLTLALRRFPSSAPHRGLSEVYTPPPYRGRPAVRPREHRAVGVLGYKVGMMNLWDDNNVRHPITVICVDRCHVMQIKEPQPTERRGRWAVQVGAGPRRPYKTPKPQRYHCAKAGVEPKRKFAEFLVDESALKGLSVGQHLSANRFFPGQFVDVTGISIGKGTQGVMKRWGFSGGPASHGCSKAHRKGGSIGMSTKPGRVFKGKKMAGRMGNKRVTVLNLEVKKVDAERDLIFVRGAVPGNAGCWVRVRSAVSRRIVNAKIAEQKGLQLIGGAPVCAPEPPADSLADSPAA